MLTMNAKTLGFGSTFLLVLIFGAVVIAPQYTDKQLQKVSANYRPRTALEEKGRHLYMKEGCQYCHSQCIRSVDWGLGAERIAQAGDYAGDIAPQIGSIRNGPDLSQVGGEHPDDWHTAHFYKPRWTRPESFMPSYAYWTGDELEAMLAYIQSLGGKLADQRVARQWEWRRQAIAAYEKGADENIQWLHQNVPTGWLEVPSPYPLTEAGFKRGQVIYRRHCLGCHGPVGDGQGPAVAFIYPPPLNFTTLHRIGLEGGATGGMLYYQIMNGITGTAMPYFKRELESEKIWDVSNFVAKQFIGIVDANQEPKGIDAAYEPAEDSVWAPSDAQPVWPRPLQQAPVAVPAPSSESSPISATPGDTEDPDTVAPDAGSPDGASPGADSVDTASPDYRAPDAGPPDAAPPDAAPPDAGPPDAAPPDAGSSQNAPQPIPGPTDNDSTKIIDGEGH